jgi:hypothetical protein
MLCTDLDRIRRDRDIESIRLFHRPPAIEMKAFRVAPPLPPTRVVGVMALGVAVADDEELDRVGDVDIGLAFNSRCDVTVATVVADGDPVSQEQAALEFLNGDLVLHRVEVVLGL